MLPVSDLITQFTRRVNRTVPAVDASTNFLEEIMLLPESFSTGGDARVRFADKRPRMRVTVGTHPNVVGALQNQPTEHALYDAHVGVSWAR